MSGYRFCRTDDIPLLVDTYNRIYVPQVKGSEELTPETYKLAMREIELWASSCMLAVAEDRPVGVMFATKSADEALIWRIAVEPEHQRQGHGQHLLTSLSQKAAILGPSRLVVEVPEERTDVRAFFEKSGYTHETRYTDFRLEQPRPAQPGGMVSEAGFDDLAGAGVLDPAVRRSWERRLKTLEHRKARLTGLAIASESRIEAWLLHRLDSPTGLRQIVALGSADSAGSRPLLAILMHYLASETAEPVVIPRISRDEIEFEWLEATGFRPVGSFLGYVHEAAAE